MDPINSEIIHQSPVAMEDWIDKGSDEAGDGHCLGTLRVTMSIVSLEFPSLEFEPVALSRQGLTARGTRRLHEALKLRRGRDTEVRFGQKWGIGGIFASGGAFTPRSSLLVRGRKASQPAMCDSNGCRFLQGLLDGAESSLPQRALATRSSGQQKRESGVDYHDHTDLGSESPGASDVSVVHSPE